MISTCNQCHPQTKIKRFRNFRNYFRQLLEILTTCNSVKTEPKLVLTTLQNSPLGQIWCRDFRKAEKTYANSSGLWDRLYGGLTLLVCTVAQKMMDLSQFWFKFDQVKTGKTAFCVLSVHLWHVCVFINTFNSWQFSKFCTVFTSFRQFCFSLICIIWLFSIATTIQRCSFKKERV